MIRFQTAWAKGGTYENTHCLSLRVLKKDKQTAEAEDIAKQHDNTRRALRDALPLVLPSWSLPFYFGMHLDDTKNERKKK